MSEIQTMKVPGIVIFTAVLNFISVASFLFMSVLWLLAIIFGNVMGMAEFVTRHLQNYSQTPNFSYGLVSVFVTLLVVSLLFLFYFLFIGIGLLKGKTLAWYLQIGNSIIFLLIFPIFTLINGIILFMFFKPAVRNFFKV